jgi:hypothetical protein
MKECFVGIQTVVKHRLRPVPTLGLDRACFSAPVHAKTSQSKKKRAGRKRVFRDPDRELDAEERRVVDETV